MKTTMRALVLALLALQIAACSSTPPPALAPEPGPDSQAASVSDVPYRPVMAGTSGYNSGARP